MSDLIERGNKILERPRNYSDSSLLDWMEEAITALSPVLPDDVAEVLKEIEISVNCNQMHDEDAKIIADLLERQAREIASLEVSAIHRKWQSAMDRANRLEEMLQSAIEREICNERHIEQLEAARNEALEYLQREGTPYVNSAIAALQENE